MSFRVRFTKRAEADLARLYEFILERDSSDWEIAERALEAIKDGVHVLETSPFSCRKATQGNTFLRELIIPFGSGGYVALFEIEDSETVTDFKLHHAAPHFQVTR